MSMDDENSKLTRITITIPQDVLARLDAYAKRSRWSRSTAAAALIEDGLPADQDQELARGAR